MHHETGGAGNMRGFPHLSNTALVQYLPPQTSSTVGRNHSFGNCATTAPKPMNFAKLSCITGLCLLAANVAHAATATWIFDGQSGSGPYPVDSPVDDPIQPTSRLSLTLPRGVFSSISPGAAAPGSGDYLLLSASSQAINSGTELNFTLNLSGPAEIDSLSYAAIVFMLNQGRGLHPIYGRSGRITSNSAFSFQPPGPQNQCSANRSDARSSVSPLAWSSS